VGNVADLLMEVAASLSARQWLRNAASDGAAKADAAALKAAWRRE
jgi:hypothetical protein